MAGEAIIVAAITSVVGPSILHLFNRRNLRRAIGSPNGQGDLYAITERTENKVDDVVRRVASVEGRTAGVERRMGEHEAAHLANLPTTNN